MFKLIFGLIIVGLIIFIINEIRKANTKAKEQMNASKDLLDAQEELANLDYREDVADVRKVVQKREKQVSAKESKLNKE